MLILKYIRTTIYIESVIKEEVTFLLETKDRRNVILLPNKT